MARKLRAVLIPLVVGLLVLEGGAQVFYRLTHGRWLWQSDAFRIHYTTPAPPPRDYTLTPGYTDGVIDIDSNGFRKLGVKTCGGAVVVCLGDSVPFGAGVKDAQSYPARLQALANAQGCCTQVVNAGVPSYTFAQSFARLWEEVYPRFKGRIRVVVLQAANDVSLLTYYRSAYQPGITWAAQRFASAWKGGLERWVALAGYVRRAVEVLRERRGYGRVDPRPMLDYVRRVLEDNLPRCTAKGWRVILLPVVLADLHGAGWVRRVLIGKYIRIWGDVVQRLNELLAREAAKYRGVEFVDLRSALLAARAKGPVFIDAVHYSPWGNQVVAHRLWREIKAGVCKGRAELSPGRSRSLEKIAGGRPGQ